MTTRVYNYGEEKIGQLGERVSPAERGGGGRGKGKWGRWGQLGRGGGSIRIVTRIDNRVMLTDIHDRQHH